MTGKTGLTGKTGMTGKTGTRAFAGVMALVLLAGCGADGAPFRPTANAGITIGTGGVSANCSVGTTNGTVSVRVGC